MEIKIVTAPISKEEVVRLAKDSYGEMVKAVADIEKEMMAIGGEYHMDANLRLIELGSKQNFVWGFNIYPERPKESRLEFLSLINIRPAEGNRQMLIESAEIREKVKKVVDKFLE